MYDAKIGIAKDDYKLYNSLVEDISIAFEAGLSAQADVDILTNSKQIKSLDIKIFDIEKQIELLELYSRVN